MLVIYLFILDIMTESFEVYVGNLLTSVSQEKLEQLFSQVGELNSIWINQKYKSITYAFIGFNDQDTAKEACKRFDNYELDFCTLKVKMLFKKVKVTNTKSVLLDLPKKKGASKPHILKKILVKNLRENRELIEDFKMACQEMDNLVCSNEGEMIKTSAEQCNLKTLEETIIRNFEKPHEKKKITIDFDLTKEKIISTEQCDKWFNLQLTIPRVEQQQQLQTPKKRNKIPFELDYRSVCD